MTRALALPLLVLGLVPPSAAQEAPAPPPAAEEESRPFRLGGEIKLAFRDSRFVETPLFFPFPPSFIPAGETSVMERTVSPGSSLEVPNLTLRAEGDISDQVAVKAEVHVLDLYNRNPTSSDDRIFLREAWIRFGRFHAPLEAAEGSSLFVLAGLAPRFTKQVIRRLESYGLLGTAVGRFEHPQILVGGTVGRHVFWRAEVGNGNPLFFRDPNALAGDNGTPETVPGRVDPIYESGFPILYDAKPADINVSGRFEWGLGLGGRIGEETKSASLLAWYFERKMQDAARIRGTYYEGELDLLTGVGFPLPFRGHERRELGANAEARLGELRFFAQYLDQDIAELPRRGYEVELAYRVPLDGLFLVGETPILNWLQPVVRVSHIDNRFAVPRENPGPSVGWDWTKVDVGLRVGLLRNVDLTAEYSFNSARTSEGDVHPNEALITLRTGF
jgi:hypothetical protein